MIKGNLEGLNTASLEAEIELYRTGGAEDIKPTKNNKERAAEIERLRTAHGIPVEITEDFLAEYPSLAQKAESEGEPLKVGEIVFFEQSELDAAEEKDESDKEPSETTTTPPTAESESGAQPQPKPKIENKATEEDMPKSAFYMGKVVTHIGDTIIGGRAYKELVTSEGTQHRLTIEEFENDVKYK